MKPSTFSATSIALSFLFLTSCGLALIGGGRGDVGDDVYKVDGGGNSLTDSLRTASLNCWDSNCPSNVGLLATNDYGYGAAEGQCSAFLIADDIVATNSHCIPDSLKSNYYTYDCSGHLAIRFLEHNGKKTIFKCKELLSYSDYEKDSAGRDFAFFRINSTGRTPFKIHKEGIKDNQALELRRITPLSYTFGGDMGTLKCRNVLNSFVKMEASSPWFSTGAAVDCQVVNGNSGSPMVDAETGKVVGIAQAFWKDSYKKRIRKALRKKDITMPSFPDHALFTNLSCVVDPVTKKRNSKLCKKNLELDFLQCVRPSDQALHSMIKTNFYKWESRLNRKFLYKITRSEVIEEDGSETSKIQFSAEPICSKHSTGYANYSALNGSATISASFKSAVRFVPQLNIDKDLKVDLENITFTNEDEKTTEVQLIYSKDDRVWRGTSVEKKRYSFQEKAEDFEVPECSSDMILEGNLLLIEKPDGAKIEIEDFKVEDMLDAEDRETIETCKEVASMRSKLKQ